MKIRLSLLIGLLFVNVSVFAQDPNFQIYLCIGQSNMEGAAGYRELGKRYAEKMLELQGVK